MNHSVVLVSMDWQRPHDPRRSLGAASLHANLAAQGVTTLPIDDAVNREGFSIDTLSTRVEAALAEAGEDAMVALGAYVWNEPEVQALLARFAATHPVVLGGPQVSFASPGSLEGLYPGAHAFVRGHGEPGLADLAGRTALEGVHGVHLSGSPDQGARADLPLDGLPSPYVTRVLEPAASTRWETQRGCPFRCNFCQHREPGSRLAHRNLAEGRLEQELELFARAEVHRISVLDPIFHRDGPRAIRLLGRMRSAGIRSTISLQCRFEMMTDDLLDAMYGLDVHLEFGLQTAIPDEARAVARPNDLGKAEAVLRKLQEREMSHEVSLIYGLPLQTLASFQRSVDWCLDHGVPTVRAWPLMLLRGTPLAAQASAYGLVEEADDRIPVVVRSNTMSPTDWAHMRQIADALPDRDRARRSPGTGGAA